MSLLDKIKGVFVKNDNSEFDAIISNTRKDLLTTTNYFWSLKINEQACYVNDVANWPDKKKVKFIVWCVEFISNTWKKSTTTYSSADEGHQLNGVCEAYINQLLKTKLELDEDDLKNIIEAFASGRKWSQISILLWPIAALINQLHSQYKTVKMPVGMVSYLTQLSEELKSLESNQEKDKLKLIDKIEALTFNSTNAGEVKPSVFMGEDRFSKFANDYIEKLTKEERVLWYQLIEKAQKASGSKPSAKYLNETKGLFKELGTEKFKRTVNNWFDYLIHLKDDVSHHVYEYNGRSHPYTVTEYITAINADTIKGFVWICSNFHDATTLSNISRLAERAYKKIPGKGPAAAGLGNACLYQLYTSKGLDGIGHLSRLKLRIKQNNTQVTIDKYIAEAAAKEGVSTHEIEDMAVEDFGLINGERDYDFDGFTSKVKIVGIGKSELIWFKSDGTTQKSMPTSVKEKFATKIKKVKDTQKQIDLTTSAQRDRIDRMFRSDRKIPFQNFKQFYLEHGLMSFISNKIIWTFLKGESEIAATKIDDKWLTNANVEINPNDYEAVALWHPAKQNITEVKRWRDFLTEQKIQQPLKQAYREVYILTDAEINTKTYSNRMAAHVLKQHQFNSLAKSRGWKYSLLGAYDDGRSNEMASVTLNEFGLRAEYWINEINADDQFNDTGIWNYVATDQVRFSNVITDSPVNLIEVPPVLFSEILRDVDLFVGVASVGNDPAWQDTGGVPAYRDYWTSYSFGDLSEVAKNRKEILSTLLPRLKINKVAEIKDKFLVVKGKLRTYKIHIGSTNILMEPNDQYLCIVPDRSKKNYAENLFIPFEGDSGLSVILSKAFLLVEDDKIVDTTITSQINRK
jgi:hypothetical protein